LNTHFYNAANLAELFYLQVGPIHAAWVEESSDVFEVFAVDANGACPAGSAPVYRLWNQRVDSNHRYTTDTAIKAQMVAKGYVAEGYGADAVDFCGVTEPPAP
jgi:hypothetical protein